jgi:hypothetical protein
MANGTGDQKRKAAKVERLVAVARDGALAEGDRREAVRS